MARIFRGHPFILVPDVVTSLTREKVIVSEFVRGIGFDAIKELDQATRDRVGETVFRFYFGCMYRHHQFSGDPHPGNFLLEDDGKVAFLDFGLFKVMPADLLERARLPARRPRGRRRRAPAALTEPASSSTRTTSAPTSCSRSSATRRGGTWSTRTSSSCPRSPRRS